MTMTEINSTTDATNSYDQLLNKHRKEKKELQGFYFYYQLIIN